MYSIYVVETGDTLDIIARKSNTSIEEIKRLNNLVSLYPGLQIIVPNNNKNYYTSYTVEKGDTLYNISNKYGVNLKSLMYLNGLNEDDYIYPNQTILIPNKNLNIYMVKKGDTLNDLTNKTGETLDKLLDNNKIYLEENQTILYERENY